MWRDARAVMSFIGCSWVAAVRGVMPTSIGVDGMECQPHGNVKLGSRC